MYRDHGVIQKSSRDDNANQTAENRNIYQMVGDGWFVVNRMKAWQGSVGISKYRGIVSGHYLAFRPQHDENSDFLNWLLRSAIYSTEYSRMSRGVRPGQIEIDNDELRALRIALPPRDEQASIADFLKVEIGKLDLIESLQMKLLRLGEARVDSRIRQLLEEGRLVSASRSDSIVPIRRVLEKVFRATLPTSEVVTAFRDGQVTARSLRRIDGFTESASSEPQGQGVQQGDVVIHGLDGFAGAIGDSEVSGNCSAVYHVCRPVAGGDPAFWARLLRVLALDGYLSLHGSSARERAVDFRNWDRFGSIPIALSSVEDQGEIGESIRGIRPLRARITQFQDLLTERRQALITAAVTGQIDVSTARGVEV